MPDIVSLSLNALTLMSILMLVALGLVGVLLESVVGELGLARRQARSEAIRGGTHARPRGGGSGLRSLRRLLQGQPRHDEGGRGRQRRGEVP